MDNIIEPNETFDFSQITLAHPSCVQGGTYFTKIEYHKKPLYIQTTKSQTKQGFVKSGKKYYCDLMFNKDDEAIIHWFEKLEERCQKLIYENREAWFQNSLDENDIETAFNSTIRVYKSGKYYLIKTNIKNHPNNTPSIKIYDEHENVITMEQINTETNIISILEIQGIKFTSRNFQIEIELKQVMVLNEEPIFESCVIKKPLKNEKSAITEEMTNNLAKTQSQEIELELDLDEIESTLEEREKSEEKNDLENFDDLISPSMEEEIEPFDLEIEEINLDKTPLLEKDTDELKELSNFELPLEKTTETMLLKKPNQVYFELYRQARKKAREAKKNALIAFLEAKNIKKTYMIESLHDSDSEIDEELDAEIDSVSESELENYE